MDKTNQIAEEDIVTLELSIKSDTPDVENENGDEKFTNLIIFIFDKASRKCEHIISVGGEHYEDQLATYTATIQTTKFPKVIYVIGNYFLLQGTLTPNIGNDPQLEDITMEDIENLHIAHEALVEPRRIPMTAKKEVSITDDTNTIELELERLVARIDLYAFKSDEFANNTVELVSRRLLNKVLDTYLFKSGPPKNPAIANAVYATPEKELTVMPANWVPVFKEKAAVFFTCESIIQGESIIGDKETENKTPAQLQLEVLINGVKSTYTANIKDDDLKPYYSLFRNTIYQVTAIINPKGDLTLSTIALPWNKVSSGIGFYPTEDDYQLEAWDNNDTNTWNGIVQWPSAGDIPGEVKDETSFTDFRFWLTAPDGAVWTATLSNGLEFAFSGEGSEAGKNSVSKGISREEPYEIKVGATKPWEGQERETELYITVEGMELKINPEINGTRKFPGTDTRILIKQTEYH